MKKSGEKDKTEDDSVRVAVRVRPLSLQEVSQGCEGAVGAEENGEIRIPALDKRMTYDFAFGANGSQQHVYETMVQPLLEKSFFKGYNATVLAYGQTGSGKTYTMGTELNGTSAEGVIPRCVRDLFEKIEEERNESKWTISVSFLEVYKEVVRDLLRTSSTVETAQGLPVREDSNGEVYVRGLTWCTVTSPREMLTCLEQGTASRVTGKTGMNLHSSRSHAIFAIRADRVSQKEDNGTFSATLRLVDLAGSERQKKTKAQGGRLREGISINKGLLALGNCISALGDPQKRAAKVHVPYRDSKLTRLLQSALGGNSRTCMIACVSPADSSLDETMCTLRYAHRARNIQNKAVLNVDPNKAEIKRLETQVMTLQQLLIEQRRGFNTEIMNQTKDWIQGVMNHTKRVIGELEVLRHRTSMKEPLTNLTQEETSIRDQAIQDFEKSIGSMPLEEHQDNEMDSTKMEETKLEENTTKIEETNIEDMTTRQDDSELLTLTAEIAKMSVASSEIKGTIKKKIVDVSRALREKEMILKRTEERSGRLEEIKNKCIAEIGSLTKKLEHVEKEKCDVERKLNTIQDNTQAGTANLKRMYADKLRNLKVRIKTLSKRHEEQKRLLSKKESEIKRAEQVRAEMLRLKSQKATLQRDLKIQSTKARELQREKERKIHKLQQMRRKQDIRLEKLKSINERQAVVSKRRAEQLKAERDRNQELMRRKANVRHMNESAIASKKKRRSKKRGGGGAKVRQWVTVELSYMKNGGRSESNVKEDKTRLQKCFKERAQIMQKMESLRKKLPLPGKQTESDNVQELRDQMSRLQSQREIVKAEIAVLQRSMLLQDQDSKKSTGWQRWVDRIQNLPQAMAAMKVMFNEMKSMVNSSNDVSENAVTPTKNKCVTPTRRKVTEREQDRPEILRSTSKMVKQMLKHVTPSDLVATSKLSSSLVVTQVKKNKNEKKQTTSHYEKKKKRLSSDSTKSFGSAKSNESVDQKQRELRRWRRERDKIKPKKNKLKRSIAVGFVSGEESDWNPGSEEEEEEDEIMETKKQKKKQQKKKVVENKDEILSETIKRWRGGELNKSTVAQLKVVLKHFDCKVSGRKAELVDRTSEVLNVNFGSFVESDVATAAATTTTTTTTAAALYVPQGEENEKTSMKKNKKEEKKRRFGCDLTNDAVDSKKNKKNTISSSLIVSSLSQKSQQISNSWTTTARPASMHSSKMR